jgi:hypothetical protein
VILAAGDCLYAVARPDELRRLEATAGTDSPLVGQPVEADADDD